MFDDLKRLLQHGSVYLLGNVFNRVGAFLLLPLYTNYLPVADYGVLEMLYATVAVISVLLSAGLSHTTLRFYFEYREDRERRAVVSTNIALVLSLGIVGAVAVHFARYSLSQILFDTTAYARAIDICLAIMVLEISTEVAFAYLRAQERSVFYVSLSFARLLLQLAMSIYLVAGQQMGIYGVLFANLSTVVLGWIVLIVYTGAHCGFRVNPALIAPMLRYSLPMAGRGIIAVVALNVDRFLLKEFLSFEAMGVYALSIKFAMLLNFLVAEPFHRAYGPFRFSIIEQDNARGIQGLVVHYLVAGATGIALGVALFMPETLYFMASPAYQSAYLYTPILLLAAITSAVSYCFETGVLYMKQTKYLLHIAFAHLLFMTTLNLFLIPRLGVYGAALASLGAMLLQAVMINRISQRLYPLSYRYKSLFRFIAVGVVVYLLSLGVDYSHYWVSIPYKLALLISFVVILYFIDQDIRRLSHKVLAHLKSAGGFSYAAFRS